MTKPTLYHLLADLPEHVNGETLIGRCSALLGEYRMIGYAPIVTRLYCVVFTDSEEERRIISLRKANNREKIRYATNHDD